MKHTLLTGLLTLGLIGAGCNGDEGEEAKGGGAAASEAPAEPEPAPQPARGGIATKYDMPVCALVDPNDMKQLLNLKSTPQVREADSEDERACEWIFGEEDERVIRMGYEPDRQGDADELAKELERMKGEDDYEKVPVPPLHAAFWYDDEDRLYGFPDDAHSFFVDLSNAEADDERATAKALLHNAFD